MLRKLGLEGGLDNSGHITKIVGERSIGETKKGGNL
jgi:hypothetical protein